MPVHAALPVPFEAYLLAQKISITFYIHNKKWLPFCFIFVRSTGSSQQSNKPFVPHFGPSSEQVEMARGRVAKRCCAG